MRAETYMFLGPTGFGVPVDVIPDEWRLLPPIKRGDLTALTGSSKATGRIVIVDGTFHSYPAVGHVEIRRALDSGWEVWGVSSMGAIRAAELEVEGMRGFGSIFERYRSDPEFADDEVTLVHEPGAPYRPVSEPLVHLRKFVDLLERNGHANEEMCKTILRSLKRRWYGDRTVAALRDQIVEVCAIRPADCSLLLRELEHCQVKQQNLREFLATAPWRELEHD